MKLRFIITLVAAVATAGTVFTAPGLGADIRVIDGDTFELDGEKIRIWGIDAPEMDEPMGEPAQRFLDQYLQAVGQVNCTGFYLDDHGRTVAQCFSPQGEDIACRIVNEGHARDWPKYSRGHYRGCAQAHS